MKTNVKSLGLIVFASAAILTGCTKEEMRPMNFQGKAQSISTLPQKEAGVWTISSFTVIGKFESDETSKFAGWEFQFSDNGIVTAKRKEEVVKGRWFQKNSPDTERLILDFGVTETFNLLNNDWQVTKHTSDYQALVDDNDTDGRSGNLVLERKK